MTDRATWWEPWPATRRGAGRAFRLLAGVVWSDLWLRSLPRWARGVVVELAGLAFLTAVTAVWLVSGWPAAARLAIGGVVFLARPTLGPPVFIAAILSIPRRVEVRPDGVRPGQGDGVVHRDRIEHIAVRELGGRRVLRVRYRSTAGSPRVVRIAVAAHTDERALAELVACLGPGGAEAREAQSAGAGSDE